MMTATANKSASLGELAASIRDRVDTDATRRMLSRLPLFRLDLDTPEDFRTQLARLDRAERASGSRRRTG